jgi:hypothetical protein
MLLPADRPPGGHYPRRMAGYSGTPQLKKLGISPERTLAVVAHPRGWTFAEPVPAGVEQVDATSDSAVDVLLAFVTEPMGLAALPAWGQRIFPAGCIWVAWPRKAAGHVSEVTENLIRDAALSLGLVDVKVAAIDDDWSGLKLMWRKENRTPVP